ncbi:MAG TPA: DUF4440 domain-containing protein [Blastocatellia bacterium]|nr:DUF4440 domain-containing protein [Blastocatellia bacterium]
MQILTGVLLTMVLAFCLVASGESQRSNSSAKDEVAKAMAGWADALNSRDPKRITATYDTEAVFWGTTAKNIRATPAEIAEYFSTSPQRPNTRVTIGEQHIRIYGDIAINSGYYTFSDLRDGKPVVNPSRFTFVFKRRGDKWMIIDHHSSRMPE